MTFFSERDGQSDCKLAACVQYFFKQIKFSSFIVMMCVLLSIIEALPGGIVPVPLFFLYIDLFPCFMSYLFPCSLTILFPRFGIFPFPRIKWLVLYTLTRERASLLRHTENSSLNSMIKMFSASKLLQFFTILEFD